MTSRLLCSPGRYVQGAGVIKEIGLHATRLGKSCLLTGGKTALSLCADTIAASIAECGGCCCQELFSGTSSWSEIQRLADAGNRCSADLVIALGGGAAIDAGKAVAHTLSVPVIVVPTTVATDAPCSALSVIYTEDGQFERYLQLSRNPDCILVDTALIAQSPVRFLVAGMGDALATYWESDTCARSGSPNPLTGGGYPTLAAGAFAKLCHATLMEFGLQAKMAVERGVVTPALEHIVEANTLLSGLSSENGGHAGAHSIHNGLTALAATKMVLHGERVAFCVLAQLVLEGRPVQDIKDVLAFNASVGLPVCLADLGIENPSEQALQLVGERATAEGETIHATWFPVTASMVVGAIQTADAIGTAFKATGV
jgi:glycerol dehydrogenase